MSPRFSLTLKTRHNLMTKNNTFSISLYKIPSSFFRESYLDECSILPQLVIFPNTINNVNQYA